MAQTIENMEEEVRKKNLQGTIFTEENFKVNSKVQNYQNYNKEYSNEFFKNSYYYDNKKYERKIFIIYFT
jgi:hypothetical protein